MLHLFSANVLPDPTIFYLQMPRDIRKPRISVNIVLKESTKLLL